MITYSYNNKIFNIIFTGNVSLEQIAQFTKEFSDIKNLPSKLIVLFDFKNANLKIMLNSIKMISQVVENSTKDYTSIKSALLVSDPKNTAYTSLFSGLSNEKRTLRKVFSTKDAAIKWLMSDNN